ncbi:MAG: hypothetical protein RTU30_09875 [Candidatus Thorarchaeota archaeon]
MSVAKKAVDSTLRKILTYTAEIIASLILLILICIPLAFAIPIWFQHVFFGTPSAETLFNPILMFGPGGAVWLTVILGLVSFILGYPYILKLLPSGSDDEAKTDEEEEAIEDSDDISEEAIEEIETEEVAAEVEADEEVTESEDE